MPTAPLVAAFHRRLRNTPGPLRGASTPGVPFLPGTFGPNARMVVEVAWGAVQATNSDTWSWTDVTDDVRADPGISISLGRADEASTSQPASCSLSLHNTSGDYSQGAQNANWPNVRQGVPVRVRVDPNGTGPMTVFFGFAAGWTPQWELTGGVRVVRLEAAGTFRRLLQGAAPLRSAIRRGLDFASSVVAYWPCEEGKNSTYIRADVGTPMSFSGTPKFEDSQDFACSASMPTFSDSVLYGDVAAYTPFPVTGAQQIRGLFTFPDEEQVDQAVIMRVFTTGTVARWDLRYNVGGAMDLKGYDRFNTLTVDQGAVSFSVKGTSRRLSLEMFQSGGNVFSGVNSLSLGTNTFFSMPAVPTIAGTVGIVTQVVLNPTLGAPTVAFGHISVQNIINDIRDVVSEMNANDGESITTQPGRLTRLAAENDLPLLFTGKVDGTTSIIDQMGPQVVATLVDLLREAEAAEQGVLFDGLGAGLAYTTRRKKENQDPVLTISAVAGQLAGPFGPTDDDQRTRNSATVSRSGGSSSTFEDVTGPLGTSAIGTYDTSATVNTYLDAATVQYASWIVAQGTVEGYRYPTITVDLLANPELAPAWLQVQPGSRILVTGVRDVLPTHPSDTISMLVEGTSQDITASTWTGTATCSPYDVWTIGTSAATTGETADTVLRAMPDDANLSTDHLEGASSISVATPSGPLWTTTADDYPIDLSVAGDLVSVTSCSGASSPQTFVLATPLTRAYPGGVPVTLWQPTGLGL